MDINTPAMNGLAAIIEYGGRWAHNSDAPVIGLSASTGKDHQETGFAAAPHRQREFDLRETEGFFGCARGRVIALDHLGPRPLTVVLVARCKAMSAAVRRAITTTEY